MSDSKLDIQGHLIICPFYILCRLPKNAYICNFPEYKTCPEYEVKVRNLKDKVRVLH